MKHDGDIVLGFELDTDDLDDQLKKVQRDKGKDLGFKSKVEIDTNDEEKRLERLAELNKKLNELIEKRNKIKEEAGTTRVGGSTPLEEGILKEDWAKEAKESTVVVRGLTETITKEQQKIIDDLQNQIDALNNQIDKLQGKGKYKEDEDYFDFKKGNYDVRKWYSSGFAEYDTSVDFMPDVEPANEELTETDKKLEEINKEVKKISSHDFSKSFNKLENSVNRITKRIISMGLAAIGIRSIFGMISSSVNRIMDSNPEIKAEIEAIKNAIDNIVFKLMQYLLPIIELIVGLIGKLLSSLFGMDIFANKFGKSLKSGASSAQKLRKQLMGFDEMNILNKDGSTGSLGSGGNYDVGVKVPEINLEKVKQKIQKFFDDNGININLHYVQDAIKNPGEYIKTFVTDFLLPNIFKGDGFSGAWTDVLFPKESPLKTGFKGFIQFFKSGLPGIGPLSILGKAVSGLYGFGKTIWNLIFGEDEEKSEARLADGLKVMAKTSKTLTKKMVNSMKGASFEVVKGIEGDMVKITTKTGEVMMMSEWEFGDLMEFLMTQDGFMTEDLIGNHEKIKNSSKKDSDEVKNNWFKNVNDTVMKYSELAQAITNGNYKIKNGMYEVKLESGETVKYSVDEFNKLKNKLFEVGEESKNDANKTKTNWFQSVNDMIKKFIGGGQDSLTGAVTGGLKKIPESTTTNTQNALNDANSLIKRFKFGSKTIDIKANTGPMMDMIRKLAKSWPALWNPILRNLEAQGLAKGGIISFAKGGMIGVPRLANGGIINRPGKGVPLAIGGAIAGERGREAVVPLTDTQQMQYLGREIAKNIVVHLTNVTEIDGRVLARTTAQVLNDMDFASNGGVL